MYKAFLEILNMYRKGQKTINNVYELVSRGRRLGAGIIGVAGRGCCARAEGRCCRGPEGHGPRPFAHGVWLSFIAYFGGAAAVLATPAHGAQLSWATAERP